MSENFLYGNTKNTAPELNVWCAFPERYVFGMSALGFLKVFQLIDETEKVSAERIFTDTKKTYIQYKYIDLIAFSVSFEFDYKGVLEILEKYNIPFLSKDRNETHPLIFGGGPVLTANPEPFSAFFDFIMIGDAENTLNQVLEVLKQNKNEPRAQKLEQLSKIDGIYITMCRTPSPALPLGEGEQLNNAVRPSPALPLGEGEQLNNAVRPSPADLSKNVIKQTSPLKDCTASPILTEESFFPNTYIIEIERGCPNNCRFCLTSYINTPVRFAPYEEIIKKIDLGLKYTDKLALLGASVCSHPKIDDICEYIIKKIQAGRNLEVSVSSLRADKASDIMLEMLHSCGAKSVTIAVEAGSERLRGIINKHLTKENILNFAERLVKHGLTGLKIYGMTGLPSETYEDLDEFINLVKEIKQRYKTLNIIPSFSSFVPKAQTPFQYAKREDTKSLEKKHKYLEKAFAKIGVKARLSSPKWDYIQTLLSRGGAELTPYLIEVYKQGASLGVYKSIYKEFETQGLLPPEDGIVLNEKPLNTVFPWDFIECAKSKSVLQAEYKKSLEY